ncbi:FG-GAP repeat domain-containing protein [Streptomyces wuyuanensis]|uniref:FG-GAP repeat domain-containing protein n=1 Tax=Streptomyces wuyuanensis TaxID=1196353 RepID=UPI003446EFE4
MSSTAGGFQMTFMKRGRTLSRAVATAVIAAAMAATAGTATAAEDPAGADRARAEAEAQQRARAPRLAGPRAAEPGQVATPTFAMTAVDKKDGNLYLYFPDRRGGFDPRYDVGVGFGFSAAVISVDNDKDGYGDGTWNVHKDGLLSYTWSEGFEAHTKDIGKGWAVYNKVLSPGHLGGSQDADLMAVDKSGVMWVYVGHADGRVDQRVRIGGGWSQYTEIAGQGDLSGDGKADVVARDTAGDLWLYKGTGDYRAPFEARAKVGAGWNTHNRVLSVGDLDADGRTDIVARTKTGDLYRYSGTGDAIRPLGKPVKIGWGYNIYNLL